MTYRSNMFGLWIAPAVNILSRPDQQSSLPSIQYRPFAHHFAIRRDPPQGSHHSHSFRTLLTIHILKDNSINTKRCPDLQPTLPCVCVYIRISLECFEIPARSRPPLVINVLPHPSISKHTTVLAIQIIYPLEASFFQGCGCNRGPSVRTLSGGNETYWNTVLHLVFNRRQDEKRKVLLTANVLSRRQEAYSPI